MVYICHGNLRKRLVLDCTRFYCKEELFRISRDQYKGVQLWLEHGPNLYQHIMCDVELRFACSMSEAYISSHQSDEDIEEHKRCQADAAHTDRFDSRMRRKARSSRDNNTSKKKMSSNIEQEPTSDVHTTDVFSNNSQKYI